MNERQFHRITPGLKAEMLCGNVHCEGAIENLSERGMFVVTRYSGMVMDFNPGTILKIIFQFYSEETIHVKCKVKWSCRTRPHGLTNRLGFEIIDPPWGMSE